MANSRDDSEFCTDFAANGLVLSERSALQASPRGDVGKHRMFLDPESPAPSVSTTDGSSLSSDAADADCLERAGVAETSPIGLHSKYSPHASPSSIQESQAEFASLWEALARLACEMRSGDAALGERIAQFTGGSVAASGGVRGRSRCQSSLVHVAGGDRERRMKPVGACCSSFDACCAELRATLAELRPELRAPAQATGIAGKEAPLKLQDTNLMTLLQRCEDSIREELEACCRGLTSELTELRLAFGCRPKSERPQSCLPGSGHGMRVSRDLGRSASVRPPVISHAPRASKALGATSGFESQTKGISGHASQLPLSPRSSRPTPVTASEVSAALERSSLPERDLFVMLAGHVSGLTHHEI